MKKAAQPQPFSQLLNLWLTSKRPKTIGSLIAISSEKSFAVVFLVLMAVPALPLPTGGITHILEIIVMLLAGELIIGRRTIWLPKRWLDKPIGRTVLNKTIPYLIKRMVWLEGRSRPRAAGLMASRGFKVMVGLLVLIFTVTAFVAPPFTALDTLPSLGVVIIALGLIADDIAIFWAGVVVGSVGMALVAALAGTAITAVRHFL